LGLGLPEGTYVTLLHYYVLHKYLRVRVRVGVGMGLGLGLELGLGLG